MNKKKTIINTIDETHQSMLIKFQEHKEETIPNLINEKKRLNAYFVCN